MVPPAQIHRVNIHPAIIGPVVRQRHNQLNAHLLRGIDHLVERLQVDRRRPVRPPLEHDLRVSGPFAAVVRQPAGDVRAVLVVEAPGAEGLEPGVFGGGEAEFDVVLVLCCQSYRHQEPECKLTLLNGK